MALRSSSHRLRDAEVMDDLKSLDDRLNLTGLVERVGSWPRSSGGFSDVWEGKFGGKKVAVKVLREVGTQRNILTRVSP